MLCGGYRLSCLTAYVWRVVSTFIYYCYWGRHNLRSDWLTSSHEIQPLNDLVSISHHLYTIRLTTRHFLTIVSLFLKCRFLMPLSALSGIWSAENIDSFLTLYFLSFKWLNHSFQFRRSWRYFIYSRTPCCFFPTGQRHTMQILKAVPAWDFLVHILF